MNNQLKRRIQQIAILVGVVIIPLMYSFFYLNAFWDPYARLDDVPVAVVNLDEGAVINGESRNLGDEISDNLKEDGSVGFVFTDEYDAAEGLEGNRYYATITIPKDFSEKLAAATSTDTAVDTEKLHSTIIYRSNQKKNYLAAQILENIMPQMKEQVNAKIDEQIIGALSGELEGVPDQLGELADGLEQLSSGASTLKDGTAALMTGAGTLSTGMQTLNDKVPALTNGAAALNNGAGQLADGTESLNAKAPILANGAAALDNGAKQLAAGTAALNEKAPALADGAAQLDTGAAQLDNGLTTLSSNSPALTTGAGKAADGAAALEQGVGTYTAGVSSAKDGADTLSAGIGAYTNGVSSAKDGASHLNDGIAQYTQSVTRLKTGAANLYSGIAEAGAGVDQMTSSVQTAAGQMETAAGSLGTLQSGAQSVAGGLSELNNNYAAALQALQAAQASGDEAAIQSAMGTLEYLGGLIGNLSDGASNVSAGVGQVADSFGAMQNSTSQLLTGLQKLQRAFGSDSDAATLRGGAAALSAGLTQLDSNSAALNDGAAALNAGLGQLNSNSAALNQGASALTSGLGQLNGSSAALNQGASQLTQGTAALNQGVNTYTNGVNTAAAGASQLHSGTTQLKDSTPALVNGAQALTDGAAALSDGAVKLDDGAAQLHNGLITASDGVNTAITSADERLGVLDGLAEYAGEPVVTETQYTHPVANYGSAFAPYFMGLSLWVGGLLIFFGIYLDYNRKIKSLTKDSTHVIRQTFLFGALSVAQGLLLGLVIQFGLGIEVAHPAMLYPACILTAWAFTAIIQFCIMHCGDLGKLLAMLLLILQLTSCAGTFPIETQAPFFGVINKFLPMTYSTQLFKEAISGSYNANAAFSAGVLIAYLAGFVTLSALLGRKAIHNDIKQSVASFKENMASA